MKKIILLTAHLILLSPSSAFASKASIDLPLWHKFVAVMSKNVANPDLFKRYPENCLSSEKPAPLLHSAEITPTEACIIRVLNNHFSGSYLVSAENNTQLIHNEPTKKTPNTPEFFLFKLAPQVLYFRPGKLQVHTKRVWPQPPKPGTRDLTLNAICELTTAKKERFKQVIIDLRGNSGGLLGAVADLAGIFTKKRKPILTVTRIEKGEPRKFYSNPVFEELLPNKQCWSVVKNLPKAKLTVLVDSNTASGAEALAAIFIEQHRARSIGFPTMGLAQLHTFLYVDETHLIKFKDAYLSTESGYQWKDTGLTPQQPGPDTPSDYSTIGNPETDTWLYNWR